MRAQQGAQFLLDAPIGQPSLQILFPYTVDIALGGDVAKDGGHIASF